MADDRNRLNQCLWFYFRERKSPLFSIDRQCMQSGQVVGLVWYNVCNDCEAHDIFCWLGSFQENFKA